MIGQPGHVYDPADPTTLPSFARVMPTDKRQRWAAEMTTRESVAAVCGVEGCGRGLRVDEIEPHRTSHAADPVRSAVRSLFQWLTTEEIDEAVALVREIQTMKQPKVIEPVEPVAGGRV